MVGPKMAIHTEDQAAVYPSQVFCDGVSGLLVGAANCKIAFHQVIGVGPENEEREVNLTVVLPTAALAEFCVNFVGTLNARQDSLKRALADQEQKILSPSGASTAKK